MLNRLLVVVIIFELIFIFVINPKVTNKNNYKYSLNAYKVSNIDKAKLENYVIGVVAAEMPATFSIEALKAQAVAARTFIYKKIINEKVNYDNIVSDKGQAYLTKDELKNKWGSKYDEYYEIISNAVLSTSGEIITYNNELINAYYFSMSNGNTENSSQVFGDASYLVSVDSHWDKDNKSYSVEKGINIDEFKSKLNINDDIIINNIEKSNTNHVTNITLNNKTYKGVEFRKLLNLRSTDFDINIDKDKVIITTRGYGHGVGMSQYGANSMAVEGKNYREIIKHFYRDVEIKKI